MGREEEDRGSVRAGGGSMGTLRAVPRAVLAERGPGVLGGGRDALLDAADAVERGADVEREDGRAVGLGRAAVVVDHIADLLAAAPPDDPVVPVERGLRAVRGGE